MASVINMLGGGKAGLRPQIVVTAPTGSTVTCDSVQGTESSGTWTFNTTIGTHTIVATSSDQSQTKTETVVVDEVGLYEVTISYSRLPSGFQEVEWIRTNSYSSYLDLNFVYKQTMAVYYDFAWMTNTYHYDHGVGYECFFAGQTSSYTIVQIGHWANHSNQDLTIQFGGAGADETSWTYSSGERVQIQANINSSHEWEFKTYSASISPTTSSDSTGFYINSEVSSCVGASGVDQKIYGLRIYDYSSNEVFRNMIPCYATETVTAYQGSTQTTASSGTIGLYDITNSRFYINSGSGTFTKGDDV